MQLNVTRMMMKGLPIMMRLRMIGAQGIHLMLFELVYLCMVGVSKMHEVELFC